MSSKKPLGNSKSMDWRVKPEVITVDDVKQKIVTGQYKLTYMGSSVSGNSTSHAGDAFYTYSVNNGDGKKIGEYHIHKNKDGEFVSGNLKVPSGSTGFMATVGRATDHTDDLLPMALKVQTPQ